MAKNYLAKLILDDGAFKLFIGDNENDKEQAKEMKLVQQEEQLVPLLLETSHLLGYETLDEMLDQALNGDDLTYSITHDIEMGKYFDVLDIKELIHTEGAKLPSDLDIDLINELRQNLYADIAAGCIEASAEVFAYKVLKLLQSLAVNKLVIETETMPKYERVINTFSKHAGSADIVLHIK